MHPVVRSGLACVWLCGCATQTPAQTFDTPTVVATEPQLRTLGSKRNVGYLHRDVLVTCAPPRSRAEMEDDSNFPPCAATVLDARGTVTPLDVGEVRAAQRVPGSGVLFVRRDHSMALRVGTTTRELDTGVVDPHVSDDGALIVYERLAAGASSARPGIAKRIERLDLATSQHQALVEDPDAWNAYAVPGRQAVLYTTRVEGVERLVIKPDGAPAEPLVQGNAEPIPAREVLFLVEDGRAHTALYWTVTDGGRPWVVAVDLDSRRSRRVGAGAWPRLLPDGQIGALLFDTGGNATLVRYRVGG